MLNLLGTAGFQSLSIPLERSTVLLGILVCANDWVARESVMALLWEDTALETTQVRLRQLLYRMQKLNFCAGLEIERGRLRFAAACDVQQFKTAFVNQNWLEAVELYRGELLKGLLVDNQPELETWLQTERETLRTMFVQAALAAASEQSSQLAFETLYRALQLEPLETSLLKALLSHAKHNLPQAQQALHFYQTALAEYGEIPDPSLHKLLERAEHPTRQSMPVTSENLFGRQKELEQIQQFLALKQPLVTLTGTGGIGKTRLALEVMQFYPENSLFVSLVEVTVNTVDAVAIAVLEALDISASEDPMRQVCAVFKNKAMLLVFDNFEHLPNAVGLIPELLARCPQVQIIVTSREALGLQSEQLLELGGLPILDESRPLDEQSAAQLFARDVRRVLPQFGWQRSDLGAFGRIHRAVSGSPLGLRLAAGLTRLLSLGQLADELEQGFEGLESAALDLPARHRSLEVVFLSSWQLLSDAEKRVLTQLSVIRGRLRGSFDLSLAKYLTQSSSAIILRLVNKSLISKRGEQLYLHETIRQYAFLQLEPNQHQTVMERLLVYVEGLATDAELNAFGARELEVIGKIQDAYDHIRLLLNWGITAQPARSLKILLGLVVFFKRRGYFGEVLEWLAVLQQHPVLHETTLQGWMYWLEGLCQKFTQNFSQMQKNTKLALRSGLRHQDKLLQVNALKIWGHWLCERLHYRAAKTLFEFVLRHTQQLKQSRLEASVGSDLARVNGWLGDWRSAEQGFRQTVEIYRRLGSRYGQVSSQRDIGLCYGHLGKLELDYQIHLECLDYFVGIGDLFQQAHLTLFLGQIERARGNFAEAKRFFSQSVQLCQEIGLFYLLTYLPEEYARGCYSQGYFHKAALLDFCTRHQLQTRGLEGESKYLTREKLLLHLNATDLESLERQAVLLSLEQALEIAAEPDERFSSLLVVAA